MILLNFRRMDKQVPIIWKRDNTYLIPERLQLTTKNRIIIDPAGKIRIERSRLQDSGKYR